MTFEDIHNAFDINKCRKKTWNKQTPKTMKKNVEFLLGGIGWKCFFFNFISFFYIYF